MQKVKQKKLLLDIKKFHDFIAFVSNKPYCDETKDTISLLDTYEGRTYSQS